MKASGPDEDLEQAAQDLLALDQIEWVQFTALDHTLPGTCAPMIAAPCADIDPVPTPDYFAMRTPIPPDPPGDCIFPESAPLPICNYHGPNPGLNMTYAWSQNAKGLGIRIVDIEWGFYPGHEDLCDDIQEFGPPQCANPPTPFAPQHGTAVFGVLVAADNSYGWTGLAPNADAIFFAERTEIGGTCVGLDRAEVIMDTFSELAAGDVLLLEMQILGSPAEYDRDVHLATRAAIDLGIIVVAAAGNGDEDLDALDQYVALGDSGAIIVGAGTSTTNHYRCVQGNDERCPWSSIIGASAGSSHGARVNVQGWGEHIFTLANFVDAPSDWNIDLAGDECQQYIYSFGGTSGAAAMVAGCVAVLQSYVESNFSCRLTPLQTRNLLITTGIPQQDEETDGHIGPFPDMEAAINFLNTCLAGDVNFDGLIDGRDIQPFNDLVLECAADPFCDECATCQVTLCRADVNGDGCANTDDVPCFAAALLGFQCASAGGGPPDCNENEENDLSEILEGNAPDCNGNFVPDACDIDPADPDGDGQVSADLNANGVPDACEPDCNANGVPDDADINGYAIGGTPVPPGSNDVNGNGVPDECEPDCNSNGVPDGWDVSQGTSPDCNANAVPDECEWDCNANGVPDECDVNGYFTGETPVPPVSEDCNANGVPDECDLSRELLPSLDCNENGIPDECDIASGASQDCNQNGFPDECDIATGISEDENENGIPDECEQQQAQGGGGPTAPAFGAPPAPSLIGDEAWVEFHAWVSEQSWGPDAETCPAAQFQAYVDKLEELGLPLASPNSSSSPTWTIAAE